MILPPTLNVIMLFVHLISAVIFVGGSFFMWMVVVPSSRLITSDESERTQMVGKMARRFGMISRGVLVILVLSGIYNAAWYLPTPGALFSTYAGNILLVKVVLVGMLLLLIFVHNVYFGRKIIQLAGEKKIDELKALRTRSRVVSMANMVLMVAILLLAAMLQVPP
jgi:putative copper resistance protein D